MTQTAYPRFALEMEKWGYEWEAHQVQTMDNYLLTTFHVLSPHAETNTAEPKNTVLCQHGAWMDAANWLSTFRGKPFHLMLVD